MPACRQCGKQNPEGTVFCGYCASSLTAASKPAVTPASAPQSPVIAQAKAAPEAAASAPKREVRPPAPAKLLKQESRSQGSHSATWSADSKANRGVEWLPWCEL